MGVSQLEALGGLPALQAILTDFYDRVFDDLMIGFLFKGRDRARLIELEVQFTARALGAPVVYEGRGMRAAHAHVPILAGHFQRRLQLLTETLDAHGVPSEVKSAWLGHARALERAVVSTDRALVECRAPTSDSRAR